MENKLTIVFVSNFLSPHQLSFCDELDRLDVTFYFVSAGKMPLEKKKMGYDCGSRKYSIDYFSNIAKCENLFINADFLMFGSVNENLFLERFRRGKLTVRYSERFYKEEIRNKFITSIKQWLHHRRLAKYNLFYFANSAYLYKDLTMFSEVYADRIYKWSYFPAYYEENHNKKMTNKVKLLWVGRLVGFKRPDIFLKLCKFLSENGQEFDATLIGDGPLMNSVKLLRNNLGLNKIVNLKGFLNNEATRDIMERSDIFIASSGLEEGWGAVINEAMNSGCAVFASKQMGATPFLIQDGENGFSYDINNENELFQKVLILMRDKEKLINIKNNSFNSIKQNWSPHEGAKRIVEWARAMLNNEVIDFKEGLLSKAVLIDDER